MTEHSEQMDGPDNRRYPEDDRTFHLYRKYHVEKLNDSEGKHADCCFFVLDLTHDPLALIALAAYAEARKDES